MAIYTCVICENYIDDDWFPGAEYETGLICPDCFEEIEDFETERESTSVHQESCTCNGRCGPRYEDDSENTDNTD